MSRTRTSEPMARVMYRSRLFRVERIRYKRQGRGIVYDRIAGPDTVVVLPLLSGGKILLERQYRAAVGRTLYELPAGHIEPGESAARAAARELEEEVGYRPGRLRRLYSAYVAPGTKTESQSMFIADRLARTEPRPEDDEFITPEAVTLSRAMRMIRSNEIDDAKTICAILFYARFVAAV